MIMAKRITEEEKAARKILAVVNDLTLDLDMTGRYLAENATAVLYNRVIVVVESAIDTKEDTHDRDW
jgi:hypothetical protein